jgi:hypothetical protein
LSYVSETLDMTSEGLVEMFEGDSAEMFALRNKNIGIPHPKNNKGPCCGNKVTDTVYSNILLYCWCLQPAVYLTLPVAP